MESKPILPFRAWPLWTPTKRQRNYWAGYREKELAKKRAEYDPEFERERKRLDNKKHRRKRSEYRTAYYQTNKAQELARNRRYRLANREKINAAQVRYRAEIRGIAKIKRAAKKERDGQLAQPQTA